MKSKRNLDVMKETLCRSFENYVSGMDETELYAFICSVRDSLVLEDLSEKCKPIWFPDNVLTCEKCVELYGNCDMEMRKAKDETLVCKKRFYSYSETPVK
ncbi:MAG: hypothetical protein ACI4TK_03025 [Agathobacter sp.]